MKKNIGMPAHQIWFRFAKIIKKIVSFLSLKNIYKRIKFIKNLSNQNWCAGMALIEILIGSTVISVGILAIISAYNTYLQYAQANQRNIQASYLLEEGNEVMTFFRDHNWNNISQLSTTTVYYLIWSGNDWATTTTVQYIDGFFLRKINISDVKRDGNGRIVAVGTYDPNTKKITSTVEYWQGHATTTKTISTYLINIY